MWRALEGLLRGCRAEPGWCGDGAGDGPRRRRVVTRRTGAPSPAKNGAAPGGPVVDYPPCHRWQGMVRRSGRLSAGCAVSGMGGVEVARPVSAEVG